MDKHIDREAREKIQGLERTIAEQAEQIRNLKQAVSRLEQVVKKNVQVTKRAVESGRRTAETLQGVVAKVRSG